MLDEPPSSRHGKAPPSSAPPPLVLVIDDDPTIRRSLDLLLSSRYRLVLCASAKEGLAALTDEVCAIILDVKMKGNDGFWACNEIRKLQPDVPVIFYSAYQNIKDPFRIINEHRPFAYITKDGDTHRLLSTLETATMLHQGAVRSRRLLERIKQSRKSQGE